MRVLPWYFDFISPFAYLQTWRFGELPPDVRVEPRPVLLGAILAHCSTRGPAEIPGMRVFTYRYVLWYARRHQLPLRLPPRHPFNPLGALRLALALGAGVDTVKRIFGYIWAEGRAVDEPEGLLELGASLGVADVSAVTSAPTVKQQLRANTDEAIASGVFGVPTFVLEDQLFWGNDSTDMLLDYLSDPGAFADAEMRRAGSLPVGARRM